MPWCQTVWVCSLTLGGSPRSAERGRGTQTWGKSSANLFPKSGLWAQGVRASTKALSSDLEQVLTLLSGPQFSRGEMCGRSGEMLRSCKSLRFSASPLLSPPSSGPRQPRGMLGTQAWALGQVVGWGGGGGSLLPSPSSPPWPDSRPRLRVWEVGKEGRGMRAGTVDPSLAPSSPLASSAPFPPLLPLLSRSLPQPWAPSRATPAPDLAPSCCEGEGEREGERERERERRGGREGRRET